jgi:hypothetical protein
MFAEPLKRTPAPFVDSPVGDKFEHNAPESVILMPSIFDVPVK